MDAFQKTYNYLTQKISHQIPRAWEKPRTDRPELHLRLFKNWRHRVVPENDGQHIENVSKGLYKGRLGSVPWNYNRKHHPGELRTSGSDVEHWSTLTQVSSDKPRFESRTSSDSRAHIYEYPVGETFSNDHYRNNNRNSLLQMTAKSENAPSVLHQSIRRRSVALVSAWLGNMRTKARSRVKRSSPKSDDQQLFCMICLVIAALSILTLLFGVVYLIYILADPENSEAKPTPSDVLNGEETTDPTAPNTMQVEFAISNYNFTSDLQNSSSSQYINFTSQFCREIMEMSLTSAQLFETCEVVNLRSGSIIVTFIAGCRYPMFETIAIFREILRENNMMLTPASLFRVNPRTLAMTLRTLSFNNNQENGGTSRETTEMDESSYGNSQTVQSSKEHSKDIENTEYILLTSSFAEHATETNGRTSSLRTTANPQTDFIGAALSPEEGQGDTNDEIAVVDLTSRELHKTLDFKTEEVIASTFTEDRYGYTVDAILNSEVDWNKVYDIAYKDSSAKTAEIQATDNYIDKTSRTKREAIMNETISPSYPRVSESGHMDDTEITQGSELSSQSEQSENGDQSYPLVMHSHLEDDSLSTFWDASSVFNPSMQQTMFRDGIASSQNNPSSRSSGSFLLDTEDMQPSETMIGSQSSCYVGYRINPGSTERMTWSFNSRTSSSPDQTISSMSPNQHEFSSYFNLMGTVEGLNLDESLQLFGNRDSLDSSQFFVYSLDDMRNSQDLSPRQTFSFNAAASSSSYGDSYPTGLALNPGVTFEQHFPESATPRYNSDFPKGVSIDAASSENWSNSRSSVKLPLSTETNLFSEQFQTETPGHQTVTPSNSKPSPIPAFQIPTMGGSCSRSYPEEVFRVLRSIENIPQTNYCHCPHFVCKIPPPPVLPPPPPRFYKKPSITYMLTKILYEDFVRKRGMMWEQAAVWDNTNATRCP